MSEEMEIDISVLRDKQETITEVTNHLSQISSIGNATILIEKIKIIVNLSKQLLEGFDEVTIVKTSSYITLLVSNAKIIATDPTRVTPDAIKSLTRSRDKLANQLSELNTVLEQSIATQVDTLEGIGADSESNSKDREKEQLELLAKYRGELKAKKDVQQAFILEGDPATMLEEVVSEFLDCTKNLGRSYEPASNPSRCEILCSLCGIARSVLKLLDLVDSLFVSKFPMRKQVYQFTEKLLELGMAYKPVEVKGGREGDAIRDMRKQLPALNNSAKVMFEQLEERVRNLTASRHKSMKRKQDLSLLGSSELEAMKSEPNENKSRSLLLRLICHVCCTSAKQASNGDPIKRGSVLRLEVSGDATIRELKEQLSVYTGIPVKYVLPRFPGVEQPPDNEEELGELFGGGDMKDVFLFDLSSSEGLPEDEFRELRRLAVAQMTIDSYQWDTEWAGDIAQATVDYDVTEPGHLSFIEGELLRVLVRNPDGWWKGEVNGVTGIFYKTFVVELKRDTPTSVPTNFKQVAFQGKPKQSFLLRKKSDETILSSPAQKRSLSSVRSLVHQDSADNPKNTGTPELKKKMSHISISLESDANPEKPHPIQEESETPSTDPFNDSFSTSERNNSCIRDKDSYSERKITNRVNSVNIDELIDQLSEYSGISMPQDTTPHNTVTSITNMGFNLESPVKPDTTDSKVNDFAKCTSNPLSIVNPILNDCEMTKYLYDSLDGVDKTAESDKTSDIVSEDNPLYEKVTLPPNSLAVAIDTDEPSTSISLSPAFTESRSPPDTAARPPIPTTTRPIKSIQNPSNPKSATKSSGKKFKLGGSKYDKDEKEKEKVKPPSKPKRHFFGRKQKSTPDTVFTDSHTSFDPPLPPIPPTDTISNSNNSSTNNSNHFPIGIYSVLSDPNQSQSDIYEQVDNNIKIESQSENLIRSKATSTDTASPSTSHYETVDLISPPRSNNISQFTGSANDLYSKVDLAQKHFRKTASVEEQATSSQLSTDELSSLAVVYNNESDTSNEPVLGKDFINSYPIYSHVTRKRDSVIIQDDENDTPVSVSISPKQETEPYWSEAAQENELLPKTRPILPPKTLSIEDVEIYIKETDREVQEMIHSPIETFVPSSSPGHKKRFSHYQEVPEPQSPTVPACILTDDDYEEIPERNRAFSLPQQSQHGDIVKTPLEITHSAEYGKRMRLKDEVNNAPLPPIPVNIDDTPTQTIDNDLSQYESIESILGSKIPNRYKDQIQDLIQERTPNDVRSYYSDALLTCVSNLLQLSNTSISYSLFTRDNSQHTKKLIKSLEMGQPLNVDFRTSPSVFASLIRLILKSERMGPLFSSSLTEQLLILVKNDNEQTIYVEIHSLEQRLNKFIRDFIYLLNLNFTCLTEKKKQEFILALSPLFFEDTSKKNIDTCRHILRYLIEHYSTIFKN
ncbi:hypothetical protein LOD99_1686 [Oopsacas minuta]|uniref:SH3 domain-containing protein n=1 Tax=Oopsacas minuta TaxID=111878 RepID=A0AAV7K3Y8_9METZ|nr:hypothetical protein LOD99_1686 [Oopsacas minuta]